MKMKIKIFILLVISLTIHGCHGQQVNWEFPDKLLFVEGRELTAGRFGDIVLLDGAINERAHATMDRYYDDDPFLVGDDVHFLSKRRKGNSNGGLTAPNDVYISKFGSYEYSEVEYEFDSQPFELLFVNDTSHIVSFYDLDAEYHNSVVETTHDGKTKQVLTDKDGIRGHIDFFISKDKKYFSFTRFIETDNIHYTVRIFDVENKTKLNPLSNHQDEDLGELRKVSCRAGSFITNSELVISCSPVEQGLSRIYIYDLESDNLQTIFKSDSLDIDEVVHKANRFYFTARPFDNVDDENIWMYNRSSDSLIKITDSATEKAKLRVY